MRNDINIINECNGLSADDIIESILESRGIEDSIDFLRPGEEYINNPYNLKRMDEAVNIVCNAIKTNENILILADTDTDGVTSGTIVYKYLKNFTSNVDIIIGEGKTHGTNEYVIEYAKNFNIIIIVDSLDSSLDNYKLLKSLNKKVIILDHHNISENRNYDDYVVLVSSQRNYSNNNLSGAGVCLQFARAMDSKLGTEYASDFFDIATVGIIADMMDMKNMENRAIAYKGFKNIKSNTIKKMCGFGFDGNGVRFSIAPRINAANRLKENNLALQTFLEDDIDKLKVLTKKLDNVKDTQNEITSRLIDDVLEQLSKQEDRKCVYIIIDNDVSQELAGLIANKIMSVSSRPTLVLKKVDNVYKGSMRATGVENFKKICDDVGFCQVDGHELAAGFVSTEAQFPIFLQKIEEYLKNYEFVNKYIVDASIDVEDITYDLINLTKEVDLITGQNFEQIKYECEIDSYEIGSMSNGKHLKLIIPDTNIIFIKWNFNGNWDELEDASMLGSTIRCVGTLNKGNFGKTSYRQFIMESFEILN